jgi:hypothetical protein
MKTALCECLGIELPIIQAPMGGAVGGSAWTGRPKGTPTIDPAISTVRVRLTTGRPRRLSRHASLPLPPAARLAFEMLCKADKAGKNTFKTIWLPLEEPETPRKRKKDSAEKVGWLRGAHIVDVYSPGRVLIPDRCSRDVFTNRAVRPRRRLHDEKSIPVK